MVEFKDEDFVKKALETMNKYDLSGRPLNIKEVWLLLLFLIQNSEDTITNEMCYLQLNLLCCFLNALMCLVVCRRSWCYAK